MNTENMRNYRPSLHYTPPKGWINDPNGLVYDGDTYHLFAQHYPHDVKWGPMHWIHAVSDDLIHWEDRGVALAPDTLGMIFSGSAIVDTHNTSGLGKKGDPIIAMFTHHGRTEQQSIAYSLDGNRFHMYPGNPVIPNVDLKDFRDPKVFYNTVLDCWSVVIAAGDRVRFYRSDDLISWTQTGEFGATENRMGGVFECPDLFALNAPDGREVYVLIASMTQPAETGGSRAQYFLGSFDGHTFHETIPFEAPEFLDAGYDNYAPVTFNGVSEKIMIGWGASWTYAGDLPTGEYRGQMTLARKLSLVDTDAGLRLAARPVLPPLSGETLINHLGSLPGEAFVLRIRADEPFEARLINDSGECFRFGFDGDAYYTDRSASGETGFSQWFGAPPYQSTRRERTVSGPVEMLVVFDRSIVEIFADDGAYACSSLVFPRAPYTRLELDRAEATAYVPEEGT